MKKSTLAILAAATAKPENPKRAAIRVTAKKIAAHRNMPYLLF
jgi:hypothetical protein